MTPEPHALTGLVDFLAVVGLTMVIIAGGLCFVRIIKGPGFSDRVVGLDLLSVLLVSFIGAYAVLSHDGRLLDVAITVALVMFVATVAFARWGHAIGLNQANADSDPVPPPPAPKPTSGNAAPAAPDQGDRP